MPRPEWNLNSYKINYIGQRMVACFELFEKGYYSKSFGACSSIRRAISNRLDDNEKLRCELCEKFIPRQIIKDSYGKQRITWKYKTYLDNYIGYVQKLIKDKGLDLSEKSESSMF